MENIDKTNLPARYLPSKQYYPPFDMPTDDRIAEAMPMPFDANKWLRQEILFEDFEDDVYDKLTVNYGPKNAVAGGCVTLRDNDEPFCMKWRATAGVDIAPGDYLMFSCKMKGEDIGGDGYYINFLSIYDDKGKWLDETHRFAQESDSDWAEYQQILQVPEVPNELDPPKYYDVNLMAYKRNITKGTMMFDDFKLSKIIFDPMDTVLMTPCYKGILKGEGGVGDIALRAFISDLNGFYPLDNFKLKAQITDESRKVYLSFESETVTSVMDIGFSSATLPMGSDFYLETILYKKDSGEKVQCREWLLHKRPADFTTVVDFDEQHNRIIHKGKPVLPISMYNYNKFDDCIDSMISSGVVDTLLQVDEWWHIKFGDDDTYQNMVKRLEDNGLSITLSTDPMCFGNLYKGFAKENIKTQADIRGLLTKIITNYRDLPNLFAYYVFDEQNAMRYGNELAWSKKIIDSLDLDHPTTCAIDKPIALRPGAYAKTSDFLGTDVYVATGKESQDISKVYERIKLMRKINPGRPIYLIPQMFWYNARGDLRGPTLEEFRNMYFQAICAGSCMFDNFAYRWATKNPSPGRTFEEEWADYTTVFGEVKRYTDIILSIEPTPYCKVEGGGKWFNHMTRRHGGKSYLFAVNNDKNEHSARVFLDGVKTIVGQYSGKTYNADADGWFELPLAKYEVEVFEFEQGDFKSSHAELIGFAVSGMTICDPDGDAVIIANGSKSAEYRARISDFAQLYINGEAVASSGRISLDGVDELAVKVVSEDGRFTNEKIYTIK